MNEDSEVPGSIPDRAYLPSRLEFSVVFSETCVNMGLGSLRKTPHGEIHLQSQVPRVKIALKPRTNKSTNEGSFTQLLEKFRLKNAM